MVLPAVDSIARRKVFFLVHLIDRFHPFWKLTLLDSYGSKSPRRGHVIVIIFPQSAVHCSRNPFHRTARKIASSNQSYMVLVGGDKRNDLEDKCPPSRYVCGLRVCTHGILYVPWDQEETSKRTGRGMCPRYHVKNIQRDNHGLSAIMPRPCGC